MSFAYSHHFTPSCGTLADPGGGSGDAAHSQSRGTPAKGSRQSLTKPPDHKPAAPRHTIAIPVFARDIFKFLVLIGVLIWLLGRGTEQMGYHWQWYRVPPYLLSFDGVGWKMGALLRGLLVTFQIAGVSLVLAFSFGMLAALFRLSNSLLARALGRVYIETVRNTPLLIQILFTYFVLSPVLGFGRFTAAVLALSLFEGAYASEVFRAGIVSIDKGQWEAAYSLGLKPFHVYWHVVLPQAVRRMLPPLTSQAVSLVKDSALVSTIAVYDLAMEAQMIVADTFLAFEVWFTVAGIYLTITLTLSVVAHYLERQMASRA
jgi:polar amino acid transport system permease protein